MSHEPGIELRPAADGRRGKAGGSGRRPALPDGLAAAALAAAVWVLYGATVRLWWTNDDLFHAHFLLTQSPLAYAFSPEIWSRLPFQMFTPLQFLSYQADLALFRLHPAPFYAHQLFALALAAVAVYWTLRLWLSRPLAFSAALLFLLGIPCASWAVALMLRHYIEGLTCAALAVSFSVEASRRGRASLGALSSFFYFLSMLEKEVYVPLFALLFLLQEGTWWARARNLRSHAVALLVYLAWRWMMLGTLLGGYDLANRPNELPGLIAGLPGKVGGTFLGNLGPTAALLLLPLMVGIALLFWKRPISLALLAGGSVLILGPIVPVAKTVNERFGALPWLLVVVGFVFGCRTLAAESLAGRRTAAVLIGAAAAAALVANRLDWSGRYAEAVRMSTEGRFFLSMAPGDFLRAPRLPPAAMTEARWLKEGHLGLPAGSGWFSDDIFLCRAGAIEGKIWEYDETRRSIVDVTARVRQAAVRYCSGLRREAPLQATFESSEGAVFWALGPYENGRYSLVFDGGVAALEVRRDDGYRTRSTRLALMVRYESPAGWVTYSPPLTMDFRRARRFHWKRGDAGASSVSDVAGVSWSPRSTLPMQVKVVASCRPECGVLVQGEVETTTREFIHRFLFPARAVGSVAPPRTEVEEMRLVTFSPDSKDWVLDCPVCGSPIRFDPSVSHGS